MTARELAREEIVQPFGDYLRREDIHYGLLIYGSQINAAHKSAVERDGVGGRVSILLLQHPAPIVRRRGFDFDERRASPLVEDQNIIADHVTPLERRHIAALA